jgi:hypothetical protein
MTFLRFHLSRVLFALWTRIAPRNLPTEDDLQWHIDPIGPSIEQFQAAVKRNIEVGGGDQGPFLIAPGRYIETWLPLGLERRLKAHLHRCNASVTDDLDAALLTAATNGVHMLELEDGVLYDERTGLLIADLQEIQ